MKNTDYFPLANLIIEILPYLSEEKDFALKGGTAINYFYRDIPRLSIDIDLTFLPVMARTASLIRISEGLERISNRISRISGVRVFHKIANNNTTRLVVNKDGMAIKINPIW
ncbi:MAG: nucleotidyl transferase AbiEii/AbiGii toxin family protein [bacterium]